MRVTRLKLANVRAIKEAEFHFQPGFNLIVGVNGVGKTSVLDALSVCLSEIVVRANQLRLRSDSFTAKDIRIGSNALTLECNVTIGKSEHIYFIHQPRSTSVDKNKNEWDRDQFHRTPVRNEFIGDPPSPATGEAKEGRPLVILFSTTRAVPSDKQPTKARSAGGIAAAYAEAWSSRELRIAEFADWMRVRQALRGENPAANKVLAAFDRAVRRFLEGYSKLRVEDTDDGYELVVNRDKTTIPVRQLSDGERGTLALVLDLTRRLAQANPEMIDPAKKAEAVVLIDEIDLHLHPKWQRLVIDNLEAAFPKCQFIATTHSPQVIAELDPERVAVMVGGEVLYADRTKGMDSNWILKHVMEGADRPPESSDAIAEVEATIGRGSYIKARSQMEKYRDAGLNLPEWSVLEARIARLEAIDS